MLKTDALNQLKQLKSDIKASRNLQLGQVKGTGQKFGFVALDSGRDIFLPPDEMLRVLPGDRIEVEIKKDDKNKTFAQVERLIESSNKEFFGKYVVKGKAHFAEADFDGTTRWIYIPPNKRAKAKEGDLLQCRLAQHPIKAGKPQAHILKVLGHESDPGIQWTYSLAKNHVREAWSEQALNELSAIDQQTLESVAADRTDLTSLPFFTIDGERTTDMDDAVYVEHEGEAYTLHVAVADPEALLSGCTALESEALQRGSSLYSPGKVVAMLPEKISSDMASLVPGKNRLAKVFSIGLSDTGEIKNFEIKQATIKSHAQLSYAQASESKHDELDAKVAEQLPRLKSLGEMLLERRKRDFNVQEGRSEFYLELNDQQKIEAIRPREKHAAHAWIEECMLVTNLCAAKFIAELNVPGTFIAHAGVRADRIEVLQGLLRERVSELAEVELGSLDGFVKAFHVLTENPEHEELKYLLLRQLERTSYTTEPAPHFAMGFEAYLTVTSPLRKANDYLAHKQLRVSLDGNQNVDTINKKALQGIEASQEDVRRAVNDIDQWLKCEYMSRQTGENQAEVLRVFTTGMQVRLLDNGIEGVISTRDIEGKCSFNQELLRMKTSQGEFGLGQTIAVKLKKVDWSKKQIQLLLV